MDIKIRNETKGDIASIELVTIDAYLNAPHSNNAEQFIVRELRNAGALAISLVAEYQEKVIGHVAISPVKISDNTQGWFGLGPISVLPSSQKSGVGSKLMREALENLRNYGASGCVLLGDPAYYKRFGFAPEESLILPEVPSEYFQAISFSGVVPTGEVYISRGIQCKGLTKRSMESLGLSPQNPFSLTNNFVSISGRYEYL